MDEERTEEKLELIDFSSEDDFLVDYPFRDSLQDLRLSVTFENVNLNDGVKLFKLVNPLELESIENIVRQSERELSTCEPLEPRRASYMRKSLAWDNAFFTNAGVLDPEELSVMNKGFKRRESFLFTDNQEDLKMRRSADSESTFESFDSDEFSFESVEGHLFEDVRASIHRSCGIIPARSCESIYGKEASQKVNNGAENVVKATPISKRKDINRERSKTIKQASLPPQIFQHNALKGECYSSPGMPPKILGRQNVVSGGQTKRVSSGYGRMENRAVKAHYGRSLMIHKLSGSEDSCSSATFSTPPTKPSTVNLSASKSPSILGSSSKGSSSVSSSRLSSTSLTRSVGSSSSTIASSGSTAKAPFRFSGRSRSTLANPSPTSSIHLPSMSNQSLNNSPASSIGGWSSELSSTSTAKRRPGNLEFNLRRGTIQGLASHNQSPGCLESRFKSLPSQCTRKVAREAGSAPLESVRNSKPSGLRMPSPKIGFFDEKNSKVPIVSKSLQFQIGAHNTVPDRNAYASKRRPAKPRYLPEGGNKLGSEQTRALQSSTSQKKSGIRNSLRTASKLQNEVSLEVGTAYCSKTRKVGIGEHDRRKVGLTSSLKMEGKRTKGILKNKGIQGKGQMAENEILVDATDLIKKVHEAGKENIKTIFCESKTKLPNFEDQVNDLRKYFEVIDLGGDVMIEFGGAQEHHSEDRFLRGQQDALGMWKPCPPSLSTSVDIIPKSRTPLAEKNCASNKSGSPEIKTETVQEKLLDNAEKENN